MAYGAGELVNWVSFSKARAQLGNEFGRILGYFREDGVKAVIEIEEAMRRKDATGLVRPAHTLKAESLQFGAEPLGLLAEQIEYHARRCVEFHETPDELLEPVMKLRPMFHATIALFDREMAPPLAVKRPVAGFGRRLG